MQYSMGQGLTSAHQFGVAAINDSSFSPDTGMASAPQSTAGSSRTAAVQTIATTTADQAARKTSM